MLTLPSNFGVWVSIALAGLAHAHIAAFHPAMYCINGTDPTTTNPNNNNAPCQPLWNLSYQDFWFHHSNGCDQFPPDEGVFLELQAGGTFTMELADNRAFTSLNPRAVLTPWGDGKNHPDDYSMNDLGGLQPTDSHCIPSPNLHTQNETMAAGTAFAIAYESEISKVTPDNLVVFTVRYHTPYRRLATYDVPSGMPACPDAGCLCTYLWIPNGCGQPNMYMFPYRCKVIPDSTPPKTIGTPKPPVWCEDDPSKCVQGPKQMLIWNQLDSNNIQVEGYDLSGHHKSPAYNAKCGFQDGPQNDIFVGSGALVVTNSTTGSSTPALPSSTPTSGAPTDSNSMTGTGSGTPALPSSTPTSGAPTDPNATTGSGTPALPSSTPTSGAPTDPNATTGSGTPALPSSTPTCGAPTDPNATGSGTPALPPSTPTSGAPSDPNATTGSGTPAPPSSTPTSGAPTDPNATTGSGTPASPSLTPTCGAPSDPNATTGSGTPALPSSTPSDTPAVPASAPVSSIPAGSSTPTGTCSTGSGSAGHSKRMRMRREKHIIS